jgi:hypothetical protein
VQVPKHDSLDKVVPIPTVFFYHTIFLCETALFGNDQITKRYKVTPCTTCFVPTPWVQRLLFRVDWSQSTFTHSLYIDPWWLSFLLPSVVITPKQTFFVLEHRSVTLQCVCFFVLCNRHQFNRVPDQPPRDGLGVTYLPSAFQVSSYAGYADLPLALLGAPVDIGALVKTWVTVSGSEHTNAKSVTCLWCWSQWHVYDVDLTRWLVIGVVLLINTSTMRLVTNIKNVLGVNNSIFECEYNWDGVIKI